MQQMILALNPPPDPTLANFYPGRSGAALTAVCAALSGLERLVYLWGGPSSGKTHLLQAFVRGTRAQGLHGAYVRAPQFELPVALQALAVDDVERLDIVSQLSVFDAYNSLRASGGVIVAAGDRPPRELPLREDLRTRIGAGVVIQMHPLNDEEKRTAVLAQAEARGFKLADDLLQYVLNHHARDMGSLVSLIDALDRYSLQTRRAITLPLLREALRHADPLS